jgi:hypothetical protein
MLSSAVQMHSNIEIINVVHMEEVVLLCYCGLGSFCARFRDSHRLAQPHMEITHGRDENEDIQMSNFSTIDQSQVIRAIIKLLPRFGASYT